ncbi:MAG: nucleotidyltransferase domain-containing protein [Dehalococcoidia bacterium]
MNSGATSGQDRVLLEQIRSAVHTVEPKAQIMLYGSRARGDASPDSDWDLLVLVEGYEDRARDAAIRRRLYDLEVEIDAILTPIITTREEWESGRSRATPFYASVQRDGVVL